ncbi:MAG: YbaB/EbfC family nucleoid-associated protein [Anaerolineales bacterium]
MAKRKRPRRPRGPRSNPAGMMQKIQQLQQQMLEAQQELAEETFTTSAGGGVVEVTVTGDQRCADIKIAPELLEDGDAEMLQDLIITAFNSALDQSREMAEQRLSPLTTGLGGLGLGL